MVALRYYKIKYIVYAILSYLYLLYYSILFILRAYIVFNIVVLTNLIILRSLILIFINKNQAKPKQTLFYGNGCMFCLVLII